MILKKCFVENFGTLHNFSYDFQKGLNIIQQDNGWGKTTLSVFIKSMFYGLTPSRKLSLDENERKKYTPWQGGKFGGYIEFEMGEKAYRIERFFGKKESEDTFMLYDLGTNKPSTDYSSKIGYEIFKIDEEAYERSTFFPQKNYKLGINDSIKAKLTNLIESTDDMGGFSEAIENIKLKKGVYEKRGNKGLIAELENRQLELYDDLELCKEKERTKQRLTKRYNNLLNEQRELELQAQKLRHEIDIIKENRVKKEVYENYQRLKTDYQRALSMYNGVQSNFNNRPISTTTMRDLDERMSSITNASYRIKEFHQQIEKNKEEEKKTTNKAKTLSWVLGVLDIMLIGGGVASLFIERLIGYILLGCAGALTVFSLISLIMMLVKKGVKKGKTQKLEKEVQASNRQVASNSYYVTNTLRSYYSDVNQNNYYDRYNELKYSARIVQEREEEKNRKYKALMDYIKEKNINEREVVDVTKLKTDFGTLETELYDVQKLLDSKTIEIINLKNEIKLNENFVKQKDEILQELKQTEQEIEKAKYNVQTLSLAMEFLEKARDTLSLNYLDKMESSCKKYIRQFNKTDDFSIDTDLDVKIEKNGEKKDLSYFSAGHRDIVGLCTRLALIDAMFEKEKPFIVFDDPFVNYDDNNLEKAKEILTKIAQTYQVIYLVCHSSRAQ
ncbi:MAG TPA: hypothetical protein VIL26_08070 [Clostridia bacterium]